METEDKFNSVMTSLIKELMRQITLTFVVKYHQGPQQSALTL